MDAMSALRIALAFAVLPLAGCASTAEIYTQQDPDADFSSYRTFAFESRLGTDRADGGRSLESQHLVAAARSQMEQRGYRYDSDNPDLRLNFHLATEEETRARQLYDDYREGHYDVWDGYATQTTQYTEGTLYVELAEERRDQLVWEGVAQGRIGKKELQDGRAALTAAVAEIFASYPYHRAN
jgi:hypothetical protein